MAVLALGVVGAALAPAGYASIGWAIGTTVGSLLFQKKERIEREGPRLQDAKVTAATWGVAISRVYGTMRVAGNIIWTSGIRETVQQTTENQGGKGGGGTQVTTTTYSYDVDLAIGLCAGPIVGIRRIWANGKLIYNVGDAATTATLVASAAVAQNIRIYTGSETQLPDPTMEAAKGAGNVPAHRGLAYVVFSQLQLGEFGNSIPNLEFEVVSTGSAANLARATLWASASASGIERWVVNAAGYAMGRTNTTGPDALVIDGNTGIPAKTISPAAASTLLSFPNSIIRISGVAADRGGNFWTIGQSRYNGVDAVYLQHHTSDGSLQAVVYANADTSVPESEFGIDADDIAYFRIGSTYYRIRLQTAPRWDGVSTSLAHRESYASGLGSGMSIAYQQAPTGKVHFLYSATSAPAPGFYTTAEAGGFTSVAISGFNTSNFVPQMRWDLAGRPWVAWRVETPVQHWELKRFNATTGAVEQSIVFPNGETLYDWIFARDGFLWACHGSGWTKRFASDGTLLYTVTGVATFERAADCPLGVFVAKYGAGTTDIALLEPLPRLTATAGTTLSTAVQDICIRAGLTAGDIETSSLVDTLHGYIIARPMPARDAINTLAQAYLFDGIESDNKIKFVKRGSVAAIDLLPDELARTGDTPAAMEYARSDEIDAVRQVTLNFFHRGADYQDGSEYARRLVTAALQQDIQDLPVALLPDEAARIAEILLYTSHAERTRYRFATGPKFARNDPTDVFSFVENGITHVMRLTKQTQQGMVYQWEAVSDYLAGYSSIASGGSGTLTETSVVTLPSPITLRLLDIPILRDKDDDTGFYAAFSFATGGRGGVLYGSSDDAGFSELGALSTSAKSGVTTNTLAAGPTTNTVDISSTLTVDFRTGTPESYTLDEMLNGAGLYLVGNELLQARTATLVSGTVWTLSNMLRGRFGTERFQSGHLDGETVLALGERAGILRVDRPASEIGTLRYYRSVAFGNALALASSVPFTNRAVGATPLSVTYPRAARNVPATNDWTIDWIRRGRLTAGWQNGIDVPIGEATESYQVDIINTGTLAVVRTLSVTTNSAVYTAAQQTTDFGAAQSSIRVRIYQMSATVGRGIVTEANF